MQIFIPTMRRIGLQHTLEDLTGASPYPITLVCPYDEWDNYSAEYSTRLDVSTVSPPKGVVGIAATRQWIMEQATADHVLMLDDDLTFAKRRHDEPEKFCTPTKDDLRWMLQQVHALLHKYAHVSIATREGGNRNTEELLHCTRVTRVIGYDRAKFFEAGTDFRSSTVMDDFEATLHLLTRGYENVILNSFVQNQRGSGTKGGASTYRTLEMHRQAALTLAARYPKFVRAVQKRTKTAWGGAERTDVVVQWKKALQWGKEHHSV
jgi:hypothetical protein